MSFVGRYVQNPRFSPDTLPGLRLWLDAADATTVTLSGSNVTQWRDKSGNLRHGTPVNGLTYSTASNGVVFTRASSQYLSLPDNTFPIGSSSFSIFFVFTPTATSYEIQLITAGARGGSIFGIRSGNAGTGTLQTFWSGGANDLQTSNLWAVKQRNIGALLYQTSGARSLWINGVQGASETSGGTSITSSNRIGTLEPGAFNTFDGQFHEVLVFESSLSVSERQQVEAYLAQKWDPVPSPLSIPGCVFWLDAGDRSTLTLSASNTITAWTEKSGANRTVTTNSTGVYSATAMNGRPGIQFSAGNVMTSSTASILGNNLTAFVVFMATSPGPVQLNIPLFVGSSANGYLLMYRGDFSTYQASQEGAGGTGNSQYTTINLPIMMAGMVSSTTPYWSVFLNGYANINPGIGGYNTPPVSNVGATTIYIPGGSPYWGGPANGMFNGVISEVLLFSNALTTTQRQTIEGYLSSKWGIPIRVKPSVLPAAHAFPLALPALRTFSPLDIDGLAFWLDATDTTTFTLSGSTVTQWRDKTNGFVGTPVGNPVYTTVDGVPAVTFNGTQYIDFGDVADLGAAPLNIFVVSKHNTTGGGSLIAKSFIGIGQNRWALFREGSTLLTFALGADGQGVLSYADTNTSRRVLSWTWDRVTQTLYQNGVSIASGAYSSTTAINTTHKLLVGAYNNGSGGTPPADGYYLNGSINEIVCIFGAMTALQRQQMEGYLAEKWGLRSSMGGLSHPFRFAPPVILPSQIPECSLWLDAADASSLTLSGSNVTQWRDKSGNGYHAAPWGTPSVVGLCNSTYQGIRVGGAGAFGYSNATPMNTTPFLTAFAVAHRSEVFGRYGRVLGFTNTGVSDHATRLGAIAFNQNDSNYFVMMERASGAPSSAIPITSNVLFLGSVVFGPTSAIQYINGQSNSSLTYVDSSFNYTRYGVGQNAVGEVERWDGVVCELIAFNSLLTTAQRQQMEGYLAWKWGLQSNLPLPTTAWLQQKRALTPVFTPTQIPGCALWLDAADATTLTLSGSNVTAWSDKSGNGNTATTATGTLTRSSNSIVFTGSQAMTTPLSSVMTTQTIFVVASAATSSYMDILGVAGTSIDNGVQVIMSNNYTHFVTRFGGTSIMTGGTVTQNTPFLYGVTYISGGNSFIYLNGSQTGSNTTAAAISGTGTVMLGAYRINSITDEFYNGRMNEVLVYNQVLSTSQRQRIEGYLAEKWGLRGSLGGLNHPSRFGPPVILPTQISGCVLWLDAADATVFNGGATWTDKSGTGNHGINGTPGSSTMPTVTTWTNGLTAARFVSASKNSVKTTNVIPTLNITYYFVVRITGLGSGKQALMINNVDGKRQIYTEASSFPAQVVALAAPATAATNVISVAQSVPFIYGATFSGGFNLFVNGTELGSSTLSDSVASRHYFGSGDGDGAYLSCDYAEILIYSTVLTTAQRQQIEGYLAWKWGLQATLPTSTHPYRTVKP